jgi:hypothetical protein
VEFQARIPLLVSASPMKDFSLLMVQLLFPRTLPESDDVYLNSVQLERLKIESFCKTAENLAVPNSRATVVSRLITGKFPLNLEHEDSRDYAIATRLVFAALFGFDPRPRHAERYQLFLPVLSDHGQLQRTPTHFKTIVQSLRNDESLAHLVVVKPKRTTRSSSSSASNTDGEDESSDRILERTQALASIPFPLLESDLLYEDFPILS